MATTGTDVDIRTAAGDRAGTVQLPGELFAAPVNIPLIHQVVTAQLAAARQGTHATKTRGQVRGGGAKPYRQKGTGRARQGSIRAPQFTGGGIVHGPQPRSYVQKTPKKMKAAALRGALSDRAQGGHVHVVREFLSGVTPSTKSAAALLADVTGRRPALVVVDRSESVTWLSLRNVRAVHVLAPDQLNAYDVLVYDELVFTERALSVFVTDRLGAEAASLMSTDSAAMTDSSESEEAAA